MLHHIENTPDVVQRARFGACLILVFSVVLVFFPQATWRSAMALFHVLWALLAAILHMLSGGWSLYTLVFSYGPAATFLFTVAIISVLFLLIRVRTMAARISKMVAQKIWPVPVNIPCCVCGCGDDTDDFDSAQSTSRLAMCTAGEHALCSDCFEPYANTQLDQEIMSGHPRSMQPIACPYHPEAAGGCSGTFNNQVIATLLTPATYVKVEACKRAAIRAEELSKANDSIREMASAFEKSMPGVSRDILANMLREACPGARQCGQCDLGPVMHVACDDLNSHHGRDGINNACRGCGWFSRNVGDWPAWNGEVRQEAAAVPHMAAAPSPAASSSAASDAELARLAAIEQQIADDSRLAMQMMRGVRDRELW